MVPPIIGVGVTVVSPDIRRCDRVVTLIIGICDRVVTKIIGVGDRGDHDDRRRCLIITPVIGVGAR